MEKDEVLDNICWICRRTKDELENLEVDLFQIDGFNYDSHTVCRACEDIIFELSSEVDDEILEEKIRKTIKSVLQDMIDSDELN